MIESASKTLIQRLQTLDRDRELWALREHLAVISPVAFELLAYEHLSSPRHEMDRVAAIQLRVVIELGAGLRWLARACVEPTLAPELRLALASLIRGLCTDEAGALGAGGPRAAALLEPALLFHELLAHLQPWLGGPPLALEPMPVLELLRLGVPDYLHPLLRARFEALWARFHQLRQLTSTQASPTRLGVVTDPLLIDEQRLDRLLADPALETLAYPPAPSWRTPSWATPWLGESNPHLRELPALASLDLTGT